MRFLLDTHALLWWYESEAFLPASVQKAIGSQEASVFFSPVSAYETSFKFWLGKLQIAEQLVREFPQEMAKQGFAELPVTAAHARRAGLLDFPNRDPFDRMLIAQALEENLTLISNEQTFDATGVSRLWG